MVTELQCVEVENQISFTFVADGKVFVFTNQKLVDIEVSEAEDK